MTTLRWCGSSAGVLREAGAEVTEAPDGQAALELAYQVWPDLIVSDLLMPRLDGFELCRRIKRDLVLSDVPVVVLSWKEDLLQRVRELGAGADGYLQKEANGSVITRNVREVLYARSRIEERFRKSPEVRGRLDTVAPRLVIELAAKLLGNASVTVRDSAYLYELELRSGRVVLIGRTDSEGRSEQGEDLIAPLLGVRVGRFAVRRNSKAVDAITDAPFVELASLAVAKARAAQDLLSAPALVGVGRVSWAEARVAPYLNLSPLTMRAAAADLNSGMAPREVAATHGERVLESLLQDLVLHDGIAEVYDLQGAPMLGPALAQQSLRRAEAKRPSVGLAGINVASRAIEPQATAAAVPTDESRKPSASHVIGRIRVGPPPMPRPTGRLTVATEISGPAAQITSTGAPSSQSLPVRPPRPQSFSPIPTAQASRPLERRDSAPELELGEALVEQLLDSEAEPISESQVAPSEVEIPPLVPTSTDGTIELRMRKSPAARGAVAARAVTGRRHHAITHRKSCSSTGVGARAASGVQQHGRAMEFEV